MNKETKKKIEQLINQRKEWLIESLVKSCIELVEEINNKTNDDSWQWTDELVLEYAVRSHLPNREITIDEFKQMKTKTT